MWRSRFWEIAFRRMRFLFVRWTPMSIMHNDHEYKQLFHHLLCVTRFFDENSSTCGRCSRHRDRRVIFRTTFFAAESSIVSAFGVFKPQPSTVHTIATASVIQQHRHSTKHNAGIAHVTTGNGDRASRPGPYLSRVRQPRTFMRGFCSGMSPQSQTTLDICTSRLCTSRTCVRSIEFHT